MVRAVFLPIVWSWRTPETQRNGFGAMICAASLVWAIRLMLEHGGVYGCDNHRPMICQCLPLFCALSCCPLVPPLPTGRQLLLTRRWLHSRWGPQQAMMAAPAFPGSAQFQPMSGASPCAAISAINPLARARHEAASHLIVMFAAPTARTQLPPTHRPTASHSAQPNPTPTPFARRRLCLMYFAPGTCTACPWTSAPQPTRRWWMAPC